MKKVGTFTFSTQNIEKDIWGDVFKGDDDSDVGLWGIVKFNIPVKLESLNSGAMANFLAHFERETGYRIKSKTKRNIYSGNYTQLYICRPVEKMNDVLRAMEEYETDDPICLDITEEDFDRIKRAEIAKAI